MKLSIVLLLFLLVAIISPVTIRQARASAPPYGQSNYHPEYYLLPTPVFGPAALGGPAPPDVQVAAGSGPDQDYVIELVNSWYVIYPKNTGCPQGGCPVLPLSDIFKYDTSTNFISDPKIIYDTSSLRWYASILECIGSNSACTSTTNGCTILAVSPYKDPNVGHWYDYRLCYGVSIVPDQPLLGISNDKVIISSNFFNAASGAYVGAFWEVYNLNDVETNHFTTNSYNGYGPYSNVESVYPVHDLTYDGSGTAWMVSTYGRNTVSSLNCNTSPYVNKIAVFKITGVPPTSSSTSYLVSLKTGNYFRSPPNASQQGTTNLISTGDCRTQSAVFWNSKIWLAANDSCVTQGDTRSRACIQ